MQTITSELVIKAAKTNIRSAEHGFLITLSESGAANARLVQPFEPGDDLTIWIGTWADSRKVSEIRKDSRATLAFYDKADTAYVTLLGTAQVVEDTQKKRQFWRDEWAGFLPDGPEGETYVLIQFIASRIELMSFGSGILPKPYGLRPAVLERAEGSWKVVD